MVKVEESFLSKFGLKIVFVKVSLAMCAKGTLLSIYLLGGANDHVVVFSCPFITL